MSVDPRCREETLARLVRHSFALAHAPRHARVTTRARHDTRTRIDRYDFYLRLGARGASARVATRANDVVVKDVLAPSGVRCEIDADKA